MKEVATTAKIALSPSGTKTFLHTKEYYFQAVSGVKAFLLNKSMTAKRFLSLIFSSSPSIMNKCLFAFSSLKC